MNLLKKNLQIIILVLICLENVTIFARQGYGPGEQDWGFVNIRPNAHIFYWLYYTTASVRTHYTERPLVIWLQGGPGNAATAIGNFKTLGPIDMYGNYRASNWMKDVNVLFIDNPVGTGFSYVTDETAFANDNRQIALDLVALMKAFYGAHAEFVTVPLHIFSQSYGAKMAAEFALELYYAIQRKEMFANLQSVALGSAWISPIDSMYAWAPLLLSAGLIDEIGFLHVMHGAKEAARLVAIGDWEEATIQWDETQNIILQYAGNISFYNILKYRENETLETLEQLLQQDVARALNIMHSEYYAAFNGSVFSSLTGEFMKTAVPIVNALLDNTTVKVAVISGQLDLASATLGTLKWISAMKWLHKDKYINAERIPIIVDNKIEGYEKKSHNFAMYWVNKAGHSIAADNPNAMSYILKSITNLI